MVHRLSGLKSFVFPAFPPSKRRNNTAIREQIILSKSYVTYSSANLQSSILYSTEILAASWKWRTKSHLALGYDAILNIDTVVSCVMSVPTNRRQSFILVMRTTTIWICMAVNTQVIISTIQLSIPIKHLHLCDVPASDRDGSHGDQPQSLKVRPRLKFYAVELQSLPNLPVTSMPSATSL
jgi:hypothetical protein